MSDPADSLQRYLVGGAVRDQLLELPVGDRDWVVVGATPEQMGDLGFKPVGADFPVFLHPVTHEEYALARTERKSAPGYRGFVIHAAPDVTLEEDLARRDLTINAMAMDSNGKLIDPFNGQRDAQDRVLRHVSAAFAEDPVRLLRIARFAARFSELNFNVAPETLELMQQLVADGEVDALVAERVWAEMRRALDESKPSTFFEVLRACGALKVLLPEVDALFGVPQPPKHHPEVDSGVHVMMALDMSASLHASNRARFAVLLHDLGKGLTPDEELPRHIRHEHRGVKPVEAVCARLKVPGDYGDLARLVCRHHLDAHRFNELKPTTVNKLLESLGTYRQGSYVDDFATACESDARGRKGLEDREYTSASNIRTIAALAAKVNAAAVLAHQPDLKGQALGDAIRAERVRVIAEAKSQLAS